MVAVHYTRDHLQLSKKMKALDNPQECVKAAYNYAAMHGQFHPMDWLPKALLKAMLDKLFKGPPRWSSSQDSSRSTSQRMEAGKRRMESR
jgi:hypothetical protein